MRKKVLTERAVCWLLLGGFLAVSAGCEVTHNSNNVVVLEKDKPQGTANINAAPAATPTPSASVEISPTPAAAPSPSPTIPPPADEPAPKDVQVNTMQPTDKLIIPVVGVKSSELRDTFKDARSEGRVHDAIDIMAKKGTPVVAAADGEIARFFDSERGGITIYQYSSDKKMIYYYAHLDRRAENLREKEFVKQGTIIGYVGDTGNAGAGNDHLHFAIWIVEDPKRYWDGTNINPYPLLKQ